MSEISPITEYRLTDHVQLEMGRRQITEEEIDRACLRLGRQKH